MKVVPRKALSYRNDIALRPSQQEKISLEDEGRFCLPFILYSIKIYLTQSHSEKSIEGTSNGLLSQAESRRVVKCLYASTVKKTCKLREEIV